MVTSGEPGRRSPERELEHLGRLYAALSRINQTIVRLPSRDELCREACEALVEHGGFLMAWIGWHEPATHQLVPIAAAGPDHEFVMNAKVYVDERPEGRGTSGYAFRTGKPYIVANVAAVSDMQPWWAELHKRGLNTVASFPIRVGDEVRGVLGVYAHEADFFQAREVGLLTEVSDDVAFGIANLARATAAERERSFNEQILESLPGIFYAYDDQGRFLRWNREFQRVSGYTDEEIARMHPLDFFAGDDKKRVEERIGDVFVKGEARVEAHFSAKDGTRVPYLFTGRAMQLDGKPGLIGMGVEIGERVRIEESLRTTEARYRTTLDSMMEGCQILDFDLRYIYLNAAAESHARRPKIEMLGRTMAETWPGIETTALYAVLRRSLDEQMPYRIENEFAYADGTSSWFEVHVHPVPEGVFVLSMDVTQRRRAIDAMHSYSRDLEQKVAERTRDLVEAKERAESADRMKSVFLATMSHELRTPLNAILGFTGMVDEELAGPLNPEQHRQLGMVQKAGRHLLEIINDVLDISKIEAGELEITSHGFGVHAVLQSVMHLVRPLAAEKQLALEVHAPTGAVKMESDQRRVEQILINVLTNAVKFTERGGVTLDVAVIGDLIRFRVRDTGRGIAASDLDKLFQPFRQLDDGLQRRNEGTGLGLAICRRLAEMLGGSIVVESELGVGSTFTVLLPLVQQGQPR